MFEKIDRVNKLAKALKDSSMAKDMDEAVKMAEEMVDQGEKDIKEISEHPSAEDLVEGETKITARERIKDVFHRKEEFELPKEKAEELLEEVEKEEERQERLGKIKEEINEIKDDIKEAVESPNTQKIKEIKEEIKELKKDVEEVEEE